MRWQVLSVCLLSAVSLGAAVLTGEEMPLRRLRRATFEYDPNCDTGYTSVNPNHTMCIIDGEGVGTNVEITQADKDLIIQVHNNARAAVNPLAANMMKTYYDDDIAEVAAKWARQCIFEHDKARGVLSLPGIYVGQNGHAGSYGWEGIVQAWINEIQYFEYGTGSTTGDWKAVGHYTQVVAAQTQRIGCGQADCNGTPHTWCNYAIGQYGVKEPWKQSTESCSDCPNSCDASGKLCDCSGKLCLNGGNLDINTCQCTCDFYFEGDTCETPVCGGKRCLNGGTLDKSTCTCSCYDIYSGDTCETLNCPSGDSWVCGPGNQWPPDHCRFSNVPYSCPYMCGKCPHQCGEKMCYNAGTMDYSTCTCTCHADYEGDECQTAVCGGKKCENGGTLNKNDCTCQCTSLYTGDTCETLNCPAGDSWVCGPGNQWPPDYCRFSNVPYSCPYMCGKCPHQCGEKMCYNAGTMDYSTCTCSCHQDYEGDECQTAVCGGKKCENGGTLNKNDCTCQCISLYTGDTCATLNCPNPSDGDAWYCGPGKQWPPNYCSYSNVPPACPYMCGKCPHQCGEKMCYNAGTMDYSTCTCTCKTGFTGDECKTQV